MRNTTIATTVAVFLCAGSLGCKTPTQMAWWKSAGKTDAVESTALANSAPALPADIAKQAESMAAASPSIELSGGESAPAFSPTAVAAAPPFTPSTPPTTAPTGAYPSTNASAYPTTAAPSVAATTPVPQSDNLGTVSLPYNPNAVPPAKSMAASTPTTSPANTVDRYSNAVPSNTVASSTASAYTPPAPNASSQQSSMDRYGNASAQTIASAVPNIPTTSSPATQTPTESASAYVATAPATTPATTTTAPAPTSYPAIGDRYASASTSPAPPVITPTAPLAQTAAPASTVAPTTPAPMVASATPYRPGGTSSYPVGAASQPAIEVATRPAASATMGQQVPNVNTPSTTTEQAPAPRYR